ncbi:hypothetical protein EWM64_g4514 [Hericium alpestre]|uniref:Uncharacterized protein n=1 Tax=Hericium alpestre TaxID=135208 RepID=A0A4Y9ZY74_9AGAM|nr:hypothetical protein EWM64_g4514 [Hericium alpestre]
MLSSSEAKRKLAAAARVNRPKAEGSPPSAGPAQATCVQRQPTVSSVAQTNSAPANSTSTIPARAPTVRVWYVTRSVNPNSKAEKLSKEIVHESYGQDIPKKTKSNPMQATSRDIATALPLKKTASASAHAKTKRMPIAETAKLAQKQAQVQEKKAVAARAKSKKAKAADEARDEPMDADGPVVLPPREEPKELESGHWAFGANGEALKPKPVTPEARKSMLTGVVVTK